MRKLISWDVENQEFWDTKGKKIANRNLWISVLSLFLSFVVWQLWSIIAVKLPSIGFQFTSNQLFWLVALPALSGSVLRMFYSFVIPIFGGRTWTTISTASLLIPTIWIAFGIQNLNTSYTVMVIIALLCGFGGGNFSSSMSNIAFFFPKKEKGRALGINAGVGNLGVSAAQLVTSIIITTNVFYFLFMDGQVSVNSNHEFTHVWMQNAGLIWIPLILLSTILAWFGMNNLPNINSSIKEQLIVFKRKHNWIMCLLYMGSFGSFIGFSAGFGLLTQNLFPKVNAINYVFLGPLLGSIFRVVGGHLSDKFSAVKITSYSFTMMILGVIGVILCLPNILFDNGSFLGFFICFILLFTFSGIANGSTFAQTPYVFLKWHKNNNKHNEKESVIQYIATKETSTVLGVMGSIGGFGGFFIPQNFGFSIKTFGSPFFALVFFIVFYILCLFINWWFYLRKNSKLNLTQN